MFIINSKSFDTQNRVVVSGFFKEIPEEVVIFYDTEIKLIEIMDAETAPFKASITYKVDSKNRVTIPAWVRNKKIVSSLCLAIEPGSGQQHVFIKTNESTL